MRKHRHLYLDDTLFITRQSFVATNLVKFMLLSFMLLPYQIFFSKHWAKGLTVMIKKVKGDIRVDKLRALLLIEADFNSLNKLIFSIRIIKASEQHRRMSEEIFGSRNNLSAILVVVNRRLVTDTFRQKRRSGAIAGVDISQCYDCIVHSLSIILLKKEGVSLPSIMMMFGVIQSVLYFIRTTFSKSTDFYGGK